MKRIITALLIAAMIITFCSCTSKTEESSSPIMTKEKATSDSAKPLDFPVQKKNTWEKSENTFGARYSFSLKEFTSYLNNYYEQMSQEKSVQKFSYDKWQVLSENLLDDNNVSYKSYYYLTDTVTLTASVEVLSDKVISVGCGCTTKAFESDSNLSYSVLTMSAMLACVAGGYDIDNMQFFYYVYLDAANNEKSFFYNNSAYVVNCKEYDTDRESVVMFMTSPVDDNSKAQLKLEDYTDFEESARFS